MHCGQHGVSCLHQKEESVISGRSCAGAAGSGAGDAVLVAAGPWGSRWLWFMHSQTLRCRLPAFETLVWATWRGMFLEEKGRQVFLVSSGSWTLFFLTLQVTLEKSFGVFSENGRLVECSKFPNM